MSNIHKKYRKTPITQKRVQIISKALHSLKPWALINLLLSKEFRDYASYESLDELVEALDANYPEKILLEDLRNAQEWIEIYGDSWGAEVRSMQLKDKQHSSAPFWISQEWAQDKQQAQEAVYRDVIHYLPEWPFEALPKRIVDAYKKLPRLDDHDADRVPPVRRQTKQT